MTLEEKILQIFQKTQNPLGVSEIAREIGTERGVVHYHLKKLTERGTLQSSEGKYTLTDMSEKIENIIELLSKKDCNILEIQTLGYDKDAIRNLLYLLQSKGLVHIEQSKGFGTGEYHDRETKYSLTPFAYSEKGLCPICKKKIDISGNIIIATRNVPFTGLDWANVSIHTGCYADSGDVSKKDVMCDYCGLPISPKPLLGNRIGPTDLYNNFYHVEIYTIGFLESNLLLTVNQYYGKNSVPKKPEDYIEINNKIKEQFNSYAAKRCGINEIPEWILKGMELDEKPEIDTDSEVKKISKKLQDSDARKEFLMGMEKLKDIPYEQNISSYKSIEEKHDNSDSFKEYILEMNRINNIIKEQSELRSRMPTYLEIVHDINNNLIHCDLSNLNESEAFFNFIKKYHNNLPEDYDIKSRIKDIWSAALKIKQERENSILRMYEKLLQPSGFVYTNIEPEWPFDPREKEYIREKGSGRSNIFLKRFEAYQFIAFKNGDKFYHPFCAEKRGLKDDSYCNNINSKGGEKVE